PLPSFPTRRSSDLPTCFTRLIDFLVGPTTFGPNQRGDPAASLVRFPGGSRERCSASFRKHQTQFINFLSLDKVIERDWIFNFHQARATTLLGRFQGDSPPAD